MWKIVNNFPRYEVNECGEIRNTRTNKLLQPSVRKNGRAVVLLVQCSLKRLKFVHNLVADAFLPKRKGGEFVHHKDGDFLNNCVDNLFYSTKLDFGHKSGGRHPKCFTIAGTQYVGVEKASKQLGIGCEKLRKYIKGEISESELYLNANKKPITVNKMRFECVSDCANYLGINRKTLYKILKRVSSKESYELKIEHTRREV